MDSATWAKYLDLQLFSHLNLEDKFHIQGGWNVMTRGRSEEVVFEDKEEAMALEASVTRYDDAKVIDDASSG